MSNTYPTNTINRGPRGRRVVRFAACFVNPLVLFVAGRPWMPVVGILYHRGRRSAREYATPMGVRRRGDGFVIPRRCSENAAWYQNIKAAGEGRVKYLGRHYRVVEPEVVDYATARPAFPRYERAQFRLIGINEYLHLRAVPGLPATRGGGERSEPEGTHINQMHKEKNHMATNIAISPKSTPRNSNLSPVVIPLPHLMLVPDVPFFNVPLPPIP